MPLIDVSILTVTDIFGVSTNRKFVAYVRLHGQSMRTNAASGKTGVINFSERFRFQFTPEARGRTKNEVVVELWAKSFFSESCVSVAFLNLDDKPLVQGQPLTFNLLGRFENSQSKIQVAITPVDFGTQPMQPPPQQNPTYPAPPTQFDHAMPPPLFSGAAHGIPIDQPYPTAAYLPAGATRDGGYCEASPLPPPQPVGDALPPPLYGMPASTNPRQDYPTKQKQV